MTNNKIISKSQIPVNQGKKFGILKLVLVIYSTHDIFMVYRFRSRQIHAFNDGDLDIYLANQGMEPVFFRNNVGQSRHWLGLRLIGRPDAGSNRDAIGARVTVLSAQGQQIRELDGGNCWPI